MERESEPKSQFKKPVGPLFAVVSLAEQHVTFYDANGLYARGLVSTGVPGHPTPTGIFTILEKERWHRSNIYSGAPMPFMQRLAWTGVAMHEGAVHPGQTASHGCIRMQAEFARELFAVTNTGQRVIISPQEITPADIVHAHLPAPKLQTPPAEAAGDKTSANKNGALEPVALDPKAPASSPAQAVNPLEFAKALKAAAAAKAAGAIAAKKAALALLDSKPVEARLAARELDAAEDALRRARDEMEDATRGAAKAEGDEAVEEGGGEENRRRSQACRGGGQSPRCRRGQGRQGRRRFWPRRMPFAMPMPRRPKPRTKPSKQRGAWSRCPFSSAARRGRLYVRQATEHLFDMPIAIRDPGKPLGTHLFIATGAASDGASLRWVSLTPPAAAEVHIRHHSSRRGHPVFAGETADPAPAFPETASGALDRIEIPADAAQRISELEWTGATVIISDVAMSDGRYPMDFQILQQTIIREWD